jgi:hypothetical protein
MESGGTRTYEVYKDKAKTEEQTALEKDQEEKIDPMKALENRVLDSQREMADLDNLEEIRAMNKRHVNLLSSAGEGFDADAKAVLKAREANEKKGKTAELNEHGTTEEEENMIKNIKFGNSGTNVKRLSEEDEKLEEERRIREAEIMQRKSAEAKKRKPSIPLLKVKRKKPAEKKTKLNPPSVAPAAGGLAGLLGKYGSDSDSD